MGKRVCGADVIGSLEGGVNCRLRLGIRGITERGVMLVGNELGELYGDKGNDGKGFDVGREWAG
jgi:hypothetical protein